LLIKIAKTLHDHIISVSNRNGFSKLINSVQEEENYLCNARKEVFTHNACLDKLSFAGPNKKIPEVLLWIGAMLLFFLLAYFIRRWYQQRFHPTRVLKVRRYNALPLHLMATKQPKNGLTRGVNYSQNHGIGRNAVCHNLST